MKVSIFLITIICLIVLLLTGGYQDKKENYALPWEERMEIWNKKFPDTQPKDMEELIDKTREEGNKIHSRHIASGY